MTVIGVLDAGHTGGTIGRLWVRAAHDVRFGTRNQDAHGPLLEELGPRVTAGTVQEAIAFSAVILLAIPHGAVQEIAKDGVAALSGKIVIDATNGFGHSTPSAGAGTSVWTASMMPGRASSRRSTRSTTPRLRRKRTRVPTGSRFR